MSKILVIEDDTALAHSLRKGLEKKGYTITTVFDGWQGRLQNWNDFDLVLVDWNLPQMQGIDLIRLKRQNNWNGLAMMLTARSETNNIVMGLEHGAGTSYTHAYMHY
jgi:DNA-binding response OmpR family regulator